MPPWLRRPRAALFAFALVAYAYFYQAGGWNQNVRFDLTRALVEQQTARIDGYRRNSGDLAKRGDHYYCDKAPGASWLATPAYAALRPLGGERPRGPFLDRAAWGSTVWAVGIPAAAAVVALFVLLGALGLSSPAAVAVTLAYALGTLAWPYATLLYGHQIAASLVVIAFAALVTAGSGASPLRLLGAGLLLGFAVVAEYPAALAVVPVGLYAVWRVRSIRRLSWLVLGGALPGIALAAYHGIVFGGPLTLPYNFSTQVYRSRGFFMGIGLPHWEAVWGVTFSRYRGLFFSAPWLLLALPGGVILWRRGRRAETVTCAAVFLLVFWMNASLLDDWRGGWGVGPRHLITTLPFLAALAGGCTLWRPPRRWLRRLGWTLGLAPVAYAIFMMGAATAVKPEVDKRIKRPFGRFVLPRLSRGMVAVNTQGIDMVGPDRRRRRAFNVGMLLGLDGLASLLPLALALALALAWLFWSLRAAAPPEPAAAPARGPP